MTSTDTSPQIADTLPKRTARRRKIHEDTLRAHPGKWVRLQKVSESGNATQYKKTYGDEFDFGIRRDIEHNRWLWGTFLKPSKMKAFVEASEDLGLYDEPLGLIGDLGPNRPDERAGSTPPKMNYVGGSDATAWTVNGDLNEELAASQEPARSTVYVSSVADARYFAGEGHHVEPEHSIRGTVLAEDIQAVIDEAKLDA